MRNRRYIQYARWLEYWYTTSLPLPYPVRKALVGLWPYPGDYLTTIHEIVFELDLHDLLQVNLALQGVWAPTQVPWWQFMASHSEIILDVGGHMGYYTLLAKQAAPAAQVHAFEPNPRMFARFNRHIELNKHEGVTLNQMAISDENCSLTLHIRDIFEPGATSIRETTHSDRHVVVEAVTLDNYLDNAGLECVGLTKIDIEGAEEAAFRGMDAGLMSGRYGAILFDVHPQHLSDDELTNLALRLRRAGYTLYFLDEVTGRVIPDDELLQGEVLALRASDRERLGLVEKDGVIRLPDAYVSQAGG